MKIVSLLFLSFLFTFSTTHAETSKTDVLVAVDELYEEIALSDKESTDYEDLLQKILGLTEGNKPSKNFSCSAYGNGWQVYDSIAAKAVGYESDLASCNRAIDTSRNGVACVKSFAADVWYQYDSKKGNTIGWSSSLEDCASAIEASKNGYTCNQYAVGWWTPYNTKTGKTWHTGTDLQLCKENLKNSKNKFSCVKGVYETWYIYDMAAGTEISAQTDYESCKKVVKNSSKNNICVNYSSSGNDWSIYDANTQSTSGPSRSLEACTQLTNP